MSEFDTLHAAIRTDIDTLRTDIERFGIQDRPEAERHHHLSGRADHDGADHRYFGHCGRAGDPGNLFI